MTTLEERWLDYLKYLIAEEEAKLRVSRAAIDTLVSLKINFESIQHDLEKLAQDKP